MITTPWEVLRIAPDASNAVASVQALAIPPVLADVAVRLATAIAAEIARTAAVQKRSMDDGQMQTYQTDKDIGNNHTH